MEFEPVIGLEVHAELQTRSKMFCACPVVDATQAEPNTAVCPVCAGMPGVLPVINQRAVEYALRVALALDCEIATHSLFARKNYFYPDLPKGYQISQYEYPLAQHGRLPIFTSTGERVVSIRRVHLEEDTGKLTHVTATDGTTYSLVDLNRAGVPLLEIVSEPDLFSVEEVRAYAMALRTLLRYLGVNSGDMEKGVIRFEANVSVRPKGSQQLGTRVEIKNLNSFRALERAVAYEIERQSRLLDQGERVEQETLGWDETKGCTYSQRSKEEAHDYRYFPEPDLPPLVIEESWITEVRAALPELPHVRRRRFIEIYELPPADAALLVNERAVADYFETAVRAAPSLSPRTIANWILGELFAWMNESGESIEQLKVTPEALVELIGHLQAGEINQTTAKAVLLEMLQSGARAGAIIASRGLRQVSDADALRALVAQVLAENPTEVQSYLRGKETLVNWFFGQVMRAVGGKANPQVLRAELERQLSELKTRQSN
ncbi:Asp-tRNA(Asn)/Glu-tRNA(Gln) amidotransferase subunit GatB [Thermanaerothrix sp. 4228-RoL]|uniref:Aspartyl/glutamyl-tRNA(Asn/Gln) amidotransferase subunit B n=1 Tax=Thermanaerothrix solaris TaxID=3058434 RepID=A0ABU3NSQ6_9CHLR|nr:Asp-tRNA(Asn)/Glu-tRNA(Gln) amidotransferase subunit GatB [Thermanaerothrix sp. 4228-RoL]MDT8898881.1 Asp-tRNA(Asn)/Glu-tRNA(Gln) amidotransferase subunit GatB [Thermanaerothrix sp. 4228-RoL]